MRSIRTKLMTMVIFCILASVLVISSISIRSSIKVVNKNAAQILDLSCTTTAQDIDALLSRIDQSVTSLSSYLTKELDNVSKFKTDSAYVREYTDRIESTVLNAANNTEGAMTVYVRYNPDFTEPTSGLFCSRSSESSAFEKLIPTDFSIYDPSDVAHVGWYYVPVQNGKPTWMNPYVNENLGINMISYVIPLTVDGVSIGIVGMDIDFGRISNIVDSAKVYNTGYAFLADAQQQVLYHKDFEMYTDLSTVNNGELSGLAKRLGQPDKSSEPYSYRSGGVESQMVFNLLNNGMNLVVTVPSNEINADANELTYQMVMVSVIAVIITVLVSLLLVQRMVKPIRALGIAAARVGEGDLSVSITHRSKDEIGTLAFNFGKAVQRLQEYIVYIAEVSSVLDQMADGNLAFDLKQEYVGEFAQIKSSLENVSRLLSHTISEIHLVSDQVSSSSGQVSNGAQALAQGASEQASSVEELSVTIKEISRQIEDCADSAKIASQFSSEAGAGITESNRKMQSMTQAMEEMNRMSSEIGKIIKSIDEIAMQTNILALNAAVEAARAGAAGKGFAVVAEEVRNLAQKSAEAVQNTTGLVEQTIQAIENGTAVAGDTAAALADTVSKVNDVNQKIADIAAATEQQRTSMVQVQLGVEQISAVVQTNSAAAEESAATSSDLNGHAQSLNQLIGRFRVRRDAQEHILNSSSR